MGLATEAKRSLYATVGAAAWAIDAVRATPDQMERAWQQRARTSMPGRTALARPTSINNTSGSAAPRDDQAVTAAEEAHPRQPPADTTRTARA